VRPRARPTGEGLPGPAGAARPAPATPSAERREEARRRGADAATSLLAGDARQARVLLDRAVALDPTSAELAYRLARAHEDVGDVASALAVYCGLRARAPDAAAAADAEERVRALAGRAGAQPVDTVSRHFAAGVERFDGGDYAGADAAFTRAIEAAPALAPAYFDRALSRLARGRLPDALADFDHYARIAPDGLDAAARRARDVLWRGRHEPGTALAAGLVPGGAQFYTDRPVAGVLVALAAAAGVYLSLEGRDVFQQRTAVDPFGNPYQYTDPNPTRTHPRRGLGIGVSAAAILVGAIEGFLHARSGRSAVEALRGRLRAGAASAEP
jgi:tetratricopeptide (TPR) repeat protein